MSGFDVSTAFVVVLPDTKLFREKLQEEVNTAVSQVRLPPVGGAAANTRLTAEASVANTKLGASAAAAAAGIEGLSAAQTLSSEAARKEAAAALAVARAADTQRIAERKLAAAIAEKASESRIADLTSKASIAGQATSLASQRQSAVIATNTEAAALAAERAAAADAKLAASAAAAAASTERLSGAQTIAEGTSAREAAASLAVTRALEAQRLAEESLTAAIARNADASTIQALTQKASLASSATSVAQLRLAEAGQKASSGLISASKQADIAQGSLIGLTRITGISALGLTGYSAAAVAVGLALKSVISSSANFEQLMNTFGAVTGATADEIASVSQAAQDLGADLSLPAVSANDALVALTELAKAGLDVTDSLAAAKGVLQLSSAASIDVASAAQIAATQLNAFQLAGDQATRVAELLADASISAQGEITDFAAGFQQVGAVANQVGLSIEDTTGLLTELGKAGLRGADGGTSLRTALLRLVPTTKEAAQFQKALGINLDETKSIGDQIVPLIEQYRQALADLTPIQQQQALTQIFGQDAIRAASIIFGQEEGALRKLTDQFEKTNAIQDLSDAKTRGLKGAFGNLQSQAQTLGNQLGKVALGPMAKFVTGLADITSGAGKALDALGDLNASLREKFDFNIPGTDTNANSLGDQIVGKLFTLSPEFLRQAKHTFEETLLKQAFEERAAAEKRVADFLAQGGFTGTTLPPVQFQTPQGARQGRAPGTPTPLTPAEVVARLTAEAKKRRDAIAALAKAAAEKIPLTLEIPDPLQQGVIDAQLRSSLQAELKADNAIVAFFNRRLKRITEGTAKYLAVSGQLRDATKIRDSVLEEISSNQDQATAAAKQAADEAAAAALEAANVAIGFAQRAADAAGNQGRPEQILLALLKKRVEEAKANTQELLNAQNALDAEVEKQRQAVVARTKLAIDLQNSILDTKLAQAQTTPGIEDDRRILLRQIASVVRDQKDQEALARANKKNAEIRFAALKKVEEDKRKIIALTEQIKNLDSSQGGGFTLADLFKEAANIFNTFGSNVSTSPITVGGAQAGVAGGILAQKKGLSDAEKASLAEAATTNELLAKILAALGPGPAGGAAPSTGLDQDSRLFLFTEPAGFATAVHQRKLGAKVRGR